MQNLEDNNTNMVLFKILKQIVNHPKLELKLKQLLYQRKINLVAVVTKIKSDQQAVTCDLLMSHVTN